jgi:beta-glucosidase-like glycosyl hydrolase
MMSGNAEAALNASLISEEDIDTRLKMLFRVRMRIGHFDPPGPLQSFPMDDVCSEEHLELSMDGMAQSAAMLKNSDKTLPFNKGDQIAVIGPQANMSQSTFGYYGPPSPCGGKYLSLTDAVAKYGSNVQMHAAIPETDSFDLSGIPAAAKVAAAADKVVMALGVDLSWAHEVSHD